MSSDVRMTIWKRPSYSLLLCWNFQLGNERNNMSARI